MPPHKPKLIEVALPLAAINKASVREKSLRHGHPSTLHLWWARQPLAASRAVLWASLVDDPSAHPERFPTEEDQAVERKRLFGILEDLVVWENSNNPDVLRKARAEIERCFAPTDPAASAVASASSSAAANAAGAARVEIERCLDTDQHTTPSDASDGRARAEIERCSDGELPAVLDPFASGLGESGRPLSGLRELPAVLDPFAGGGSIPLEAQRLGLRALASDLNPVAVLINRAMLEIPQRFAGHPPVHPEKGEQRAWSRAKGMPSTAEPSGAPDEKKEPGAWSRARVQVSAAYGAARPKKKEPVAWSGAKGLAADVRAYGAWMREEAERRIGYLYPDVVGPDGEKLTPIAWLWARTVRSPDPAWGGHVPLVSSWTLRKAKKGKPEVWVEPVVDASNRTISYKVNYGDKTNYERSEGGAQASTVRRGNGSCVATGAAIPVGYTKAEGRAGRMGAHLMAVAAAGASGRVYCEPSPADFNACREAVKFSADAWKPAGSLPPRGKGLGTNVQNYGVEEWWQLFTDRQLLALTTFSDLLGEVHGRVLEDAKRAGLADDEVRLREGGTGALAYADAVVTYLALVVDKCAAYWSNLVIWNSNNEALAQVFIRQAVSMTWGYAECNPFSSSTGNWMAMVNWVGKAIEHLPSLGIPSSGVASSGVSSPVVPSQGVPSSGVPPPGVPSPEVPPKGQAEVCQQDARVRVRNTAGVVVSTSPPYYDNTAYADISDFFYVWLRRNLADVWPEECATLLTPKTGELIADSSRHESRQEAKEYFESGMAEFMSEVVSAQHPDVPATVYYAYKATEDTKDGVVRSTGWDTFLQSVIDVGLQVTATWPLRTALANRLLALGTNTLASAIVLACRPRPSSAPLVTRSEFIVALREELPDAIKVLQSGNIAPVDLPQSTIGPGIGVFSRYARVVEANGEAMPVSDALTIINKVLDEVLYGEESELDAETRFALAWYAQHGFEAAPFGGAESIAKAKNTAVEGVMKAEIGGAAAGKFRLYARSELDPDWDPTTDARLTAWKALQHLAARLEVSESQAAELLASLSEAGGETDGRARQLAYLLHKIANDNGWSEEASVYNGLISVWPVLRR